MAGDDLGLKKIRKTEVKGTKQDTVSGSEKTFSQISLKKLLEIAQETGQTVDEIIKHEKPGLEPLKPEPVYSRADETKERWLKKISAAYSRFKDSDYAGDILELKKAVERDMGKPVIGLLGRSDSGKSTLINKLMGVEKLPTDWAPMTSINVFIKHVEDRPEYIKDEVWVFKKGSGEEWDHMRLKDEEYCREWKLAGGTIDMLTSFGTHQGKYRGNNVGSAVVFIDAPVLKSVDLLDTPGTTGGMYRDTTMAKGAGSYMDAVVYLAQANSFLTEEDMTFMKSVFPKLRCVESLADELDFLANIYVLASQAHTIDMGNKNELDEVLDKGCSRFWSAIPRNFWEGRKQEYKEHTGKACIYKKAELRQRFFPYSIDIPDICEPFLDDLKNLIEALPSIGKTLAVADIGRICGSAIGRIDGDVEAWEAEIREKDEYVKAQDDIPNQKAKLKEVKDSSINAIQHVKKDAVRKFEGKYSEIINKEKIKEIITRKGYTKKDEDMHKLEQHLGSLLNEKMVAVLKEEYDEYPYLSNIKDFITEELGYAQNVTTVNPSIPVSENSNSARGAALLAAGITVSFILGPLGGIASSALSGVLLTLFSDWKGNVAEKICETTKQRGILYEYKAAIEKYWDGLLGNFENAFKRAKWRCEEEWRELKIEVRDYNPDEIKARVKTAKAVRNFLSGAQDWK